MTALALRVVLPTPLADSIVNGETITADYHPARIVGLGWSSWEGAGDIDADYSDNTMVLFPLDGIEDAEQLVDTLEPALVPIGDGFRQGTAAILADGDDIQRLWYINREGDDTTLRTAARP